MPLRILAGPAGTGKTGRLVEVYADALTAARDELRPGSTLWLAPTQRACVSIRSQLLARLGTGLLQPNIVTFDTLAERILTFSSVPALPLTVSMQRVLLRRIITRQTHAGELKYFTKIASTSGFLDLVAAFIAEMKRGETWPETFIAATRALPHGTSHRDRELAAIYAEYQNLLLGRGLYDQEGRFWSALEALRRGDFGPFADLQLIVVDGFTDFTPTQFATVELLTQRAAQTWLTLLLEETSDRADLFAKTRAVRERFEAKMPVEIEWLSPQRKNRSPAGLAHLARSLFSNPRKVAPAKKADGVEVVAVAGEQGEVRMLAERVKTLLREGIPPDDIVIARRGLDEAAALIHDVFSASGIPVACEVETPLDRTPIVRALNSIFRLEQEDWRFDNILAVIDSSFFRPEWHTDPNRQSIRAVSTVLRKLKLSRHRERILESLNAEIERLAALPAGKPGRSRLSQGQVITARNLLRKLASELEPLRKSYPFSRWADITATLVRAVYFPEHARNEPETVPHWNAWLRIEGILYDAKRAETHIPELGEPHSLKEFIQEFADLLATGSVSLKVREEGRVRVIDVSQVRNLHVPRLFVSGLTERSFPRHGGDDCFFTEADREVLSASGVSLVPRNLRHQDEMLLFYGVVTRARQQLVLSYPAVSDSGQPLSPSPYLSAVLEAFDNRALTQLLEEQLDPIPARTRVLTPADLRVFAMHEALGQRPGLVQTLLASPDSGPALINTFAAVDMAIARFHQPGFSPYEGALASPVNRAQIAERYSPTHRFSVTELEQFAACPFQFLAANVLGIREPESPDLETDRLTRGILIHGVLDQLHRQLNEDLTAEADLATPEFAERIRAGFAEILTAQIGALPNRPELHMALREVETRTLSEWGHLYGEQWSAYQAEQPVESWTRSLRPSLFEIEFGAAPPPADETNDDSPPPVGLDFGVGQAANRVLLHGRIDRVDIGAHQGQTMFAVIDYKTGGINKVSDKKVATGETLQLPVYLMAVQELGLAGAGAIPWQFAYWQVRDAGFANGLASYGKGRVRQLTDDELQSLRLAVETVIPKLVSSIRQGFFPVYSRETDCMKFCEFNKACRIAQVRALPPELGKSWSPAGAVEVDEQDGHPVRL